MRDDSLAAQFEHVFDVAATGVKVFTLCHACLDTLPSRG